MACRSCRAYLDLAPRHLALRSLPRRNAAPPRTVAAGNLGTQLLPTRQRRHFHQTPQGRGVVQRIVRPIAETLSQASPRTAQPYMVYGATKRIYDACSAQAAYTVPKESRTNGTLRRGEDGEEIGVGGGIWHDEFKLSPTFSTWAHVTMMHMYLILVRIRCFDRESYREWEAQMGDHFFHEAEERMEIVHEISSGGMRQRYLKDLFEQWRGVILAYDEGLVKGDAVLASALWRNLFRAREDIDLRMLAAIVSWMRLVLKNLDQMLDPALIPHGASVFKWPPVKEMLIVDEPVNELKDLIVPGKGAKAQ